MANALKNIDPGDRARGQDVSFPTGNFVWPAEGPRTAIPPSPDTVGSRFPRRSLPDIAYQVRKQAERYYFNSYRKTIRFPGLPVAPRRTSGTGYGKVCGLP